MNNNASRISASALRLNEHLDNFYGVIEMQLTTDQCWHALQNLFAETVGFKLFTVMTVDLKNQVARRAYSNNVEAYPVSGTKPITYDRWFDIVHRQKRSFVANTIAEIAAVFPDHEKIWSLGCGAVVNLPLIIDGGLAATINILDAEHHYTPERVAIIEAKLARPSLVAYNRAKALEPTI